ncbi:MAG TPA: efflux RND transporter periplasmic adaptor subunit [Candidatus Sumerlaeota bacterium]|nr:efflux RND transporter periplasmic adaptor subunit [Candidatus Sumerlaeota bacterium]HPS00805.1 efflux RND transporter periplasmic adaptor subunit [Candidatus Sumerlaeota bacterium]
MCKCLRFCKKSPVSFSGILPLLLLIALLAVTACNGKTEKSQLGFASETQSTSATQAVVHVTTAPVQAARKQTAISLTGSLEGDERAKVACRVAGIVQAIYVERGSLVKKGDRLLQLDPVDARNSLAEGEAAAAELRARLGMKEGDNAPFVAEEMPEVKAVKASLDLAELNFKRFEELNTQKVLAKSEFDRARSERDASREQYKQTLRQASQLYQTYKTALTRVTILRQGLTDTLVTAPFDGIVAEKLVSTGEHVDLMMSGGRVIELVKVNPLRLALTVPQQYAGQVSQGQTVAFSVDGFPGETFQGRVTYIGPALETASRSLKVEALVENPDHRLRPGFFATANLGLGQEASIVLAPEAAVSREGDVSRVFVVQEGKAHERIVTVGETKEGSIEILNGLTPQDRVVTSPSSVPDGATVQE